MKVSELAKSIAEKTSDAYSADRWASWPKCAQTCLNLGYTTEQTEVILRSKVTRWARDYAGMHSNVPTVYLKKFITQSPETITSLLKEDGV